MAPALRASPQGEAAARRLAWQQQQVPPSRGRCWDQTLGLPGRERRLSRCHQPSCLHTRTHHEAGVESTAYRKASALSELRLTSGAVADTCAQRVDLVQEEGCQREEI